jgi:hypothetical protein
MGLKRIIFWAIFAFLAYHAFGYVKVHSSGDVVTYKLLGDALAENDTYSIKKMVKDEALGQQIIAAQEERAKLLGDNAVLFTYYVIQRQTFSAAGDTSYILAEQVNRVNPPGADTIIGETEIRIRQGIELVKEGERWLIVGFDDPAMRLSSAYL